MYTLLVNRETRNVIGLISPCHRPSQNPAMCGADTCATLFGPAAQETRTSTTATRAPASTSLGGGHGEGARRHRVVVLGGRFLWSPGVSGPVYVLVLVESGGCRGQVWAEGLTAAWPGNWGPVGRARRIDQKMVTPYAVAASRTGWKKVVPPLVQSPLPPEVRPSALVPS